MSFHGENVSCLPRLTLFCLPTANCVKAALFVSAGNVPLSRKLSALNRSYLFEEECFFPDLMKKLALLSNFCNDQKSSKYLTAHQCSENTLFNFECTRGRIETAKASLSITFQGTQNMKRLTSKWVFGQIFAFQRHDHNRKFKYARLRSKGGQ